MRMVACVHACCHDGGNRGSDFRNRAATPTHSWERNVLEVPETSLTKICIVSSSEACELMLEMLLERRIMVCGCGEVCREGRRARVVEAMTESRGGAGRVLTLTTALTGW